MEVDLVTAATDADAEELWPVYAEVFEETRDLASWRADTGTATPRVRASGSRGSVAAGS